MTNKKIWLGMLALALIFGMTVIGCGGDDGDDGNPQTKQYQGSDASGKTYILVITVSSSGAAPKAGDSYTLTIKQSGQADKVSKGTVTANTDDTITLQPSGDGSDPFDVTVSGTGISDITGDIATKDGGTVTPGTLYPVVTFSGVIANGSSSQTTTTLTLTFSQAITGLSAGDITLGGVSSVNKGSLSGSGPTYTLPISGFTKGGSLTVSVAKSGYTISGGSKTVTIYYYSGGTPPGGGAGTFTLTNIPSKFNGKYAHVQAGDDNIGLEGAQSINLSTGLVTLPQIANGSVSIPMWVYNESTDSLSRYSGSADLAVIILIFDTATVDFDDDDDDFEDYISGGAEFYSVYFSNGSATKSWNDADEATDSGDPVYSGDGLLSYQLINDGTAYEVSKGTATAAAIVIPAAYEGLPVTRIARAELVYDGYSGGFAGYSALTNITIPNSVTSIGSYAFWGCYILTSITIPSSVTNIEDNAFFSCGGLTSVNVASGNTVYRSENNCVIQIANNTLILGCKNSVIPASVTSIGVGAFGGSYDLTSITIPAGVTSIGSYVFSYCSGLTSITVANGNTVYRSGGNCLIRIADNTLIVGCKNSVIPADVTSIGSYAFYGHTGLTSITIPAGVTSIDVGAFSGCTGLTSVTFETGSNITSANFSYAFPGGYDNIKTAYLAGGAGTYTRAADGEVWTKN
jgi:hypothetical protein